MTAAYSTTAQGYLSMMDEPAIVNADVYQHPRTAMVANAGFLTRWPLRVRLMAGLSRVMRTEGAAPGQ